MTVLLVDRVVCAQRVSQRLAQLPSHMGKGET
jgi:hypothetical protein